MFGQVRICPACRGSGKQSYHARDGSFRVYAEWIKGDRPGPGHGGHWRSFPCQECNGSKLVRV